MHVATGGPTRRMRQASRQATESVFISSPWRRGSLGINRCDKAYGASNGTQPAATSPSCSATSSTQRGHQWPAVRSSVKPPSLSNQLGIAGCRIRNQGCSPDSRAIVAAAIACSKMSPSIVPGRGWAAAHGMSSRTSSSPSSAANARSSASWLPCEVNVAPRRIEAGPGGASVVDSAGVRPEMGCVSTIRRCRCWQPTSADR